MSKQLALAAALALGFAVTGCAQKTVNDVMADPSRYADRSITLRGQPASELSSAHQYARECVSRRTSPAAIMRSVSGSR